MRTGVNHITLLLVSIAPRRPQEKSPVLILLELLEWKVVLSNIILTKWIRVQPTPVRQVLILIEEGGPRVRVLVPDQQAGRRGADDDGVQHRVLLVSAGIDVSLWWTIHASFKNIHFLLGLAFLSLVKERKKDLDLMRSFFKDWNIERIGRHFEKRSGTS